MDTRDAIVQNVCTHELLIKWKSQLDQFAEGLSPLGFTDFLSTFCEELKGLFVRGMNNEVSTENLLALVVMVPEVPQHGSVGFQTHLYLLRYLRDLDEMGMPSLLP